MYELMYKTADISTSALVLRTAFSQTATQSDADVSPLADSSFKNK